MAATLNQEKKHSRSLILRELLIRDDQCLAVTFVARRKGYVLEVDESLAQRSFEKQCELLSNFARTPLRIQAFALLKQRGRLTLRFQANYYDEALAGAC
ncbi:MAG TPA: hypothetical protein VHQ94_16010 [Pyrinomonadaceae bacterium]|jgi:hypothetical protein|nr:hypothetical protein [Pyrinomonadaceae bacterium]